LPWNQRETIPVWRGTGYAGIFADDKLALEQELHHNLKHRLPSAAQIFLQKLLDTPKFHKRLLLCHFSKKHPDLLDAKLAHARGIPKEWWPHNATNGLHVFLPFHEIPKNDYYTNYQVSVVMGGLGAAFRTSRILEQGIAVILQDFPYEEWFIHYMTPFVNYIPLAQDLSNLHETLHWVQDNPQKVHEIARNGKAFYQRFLSHDAMDEFYYELIFRLMIKVNSPEP
jgi:Glycosyl transferase family 90